MRCVVMGFLACLSFMGLSASMRHFLKLDPCVAPFIASCVAVVGLMLAGMGGFLEAGYWLLYGAGFAGLAWVWIARRSRPRLDLVLMLIVYGLYLMWRFHGVTISHVDDYAHWGVAARFLLRNNAFPDAGTRMITYQSYPLGSAAWIYYLLKNISSENEGLWFAAQYLWMGVAFLPILSFARANRRFLIPFSALAFAFLLQRSPWMQVLQVDWLLAFLGVGGVAAVVSCEKRPGMATALAILSGCAVIAVKHSGMFFAAFDIVALWMALKGERRRGWRTFASVAACVGFYGVWTLRVKLAYPSGLATKHAVSIEQYAAEAAGKGAGVTREILRKLAIEFVKPNVHVAAAIAFVCACAAIIVAFARLSGQRGGEVRRLRCLLWGVAAYILWHVMLGAMYIFSMPVGEATALASYGRYISTGLSFMMGLSVMWTLKWAGAPECALKADADRRARRIAAVGLAVVIALMPFLSMGQRLFRRDVGKGVLRTELEAMRDTSGVGQDANIILIWAQNDYGLNMNGMRNVVKFVCDTPNIRGILRVDDADIALNEGRRWRLIDEDNTRPIDDPVATAMELLPDSDALFVMDNVDEIDGELARALAEANIDTPVRFADESLT